MGKGRTSNDKRVLYQGDSFSFVKTGMDQDQIGKIMVSSLCQSKIQIFYLEKSRKEDR